MLLDSMFELASDFVGEEKLVLHGLPTSTESWAKHAAGRRYECMSQGEGYGCVWALDLHLMFKQRVLPKARANAACADMRWVDVIPNIPTTISNNPPTLCSVGIGYRALAAMVWLETAVNRESGGVVNHRRVRNTIGHAYQVSRQWRSTSVWAT